MSIRSKDEEMDEVSSVPEPKDGVSIAQPVSAGVIVLASSETVSDAESNRAFSRGPKGPCSASPIELPLLDAVVFIAGAVMKVVCDGIVAALWTGSIFSLEEQE